MPSDSEPPEDSEIPRSFPDYSSETDVQLTSLPKPNPVRTEGVNSRVGTRPMPTHDGRLGERIHFLAAARGWSMADLSRESGVSPQAIGDWITGVTTYPHLKLVGKVATALDRSLPFLLWGTDDVDSLLGGRDGGSTEAD